MGNNVWEEVFASQAWGKYPAEPLIRFIARNFYGHDREKIRILELGCGPGANLWFLAREGFSFLGIDFSPSAVEQAMTRLDVECPGWRSRGMIQVGDITHSDFGEEVFDAIIDNECVYCLPFYQSVQIYSKAKSALKKGGKIFVRTFTPETWGFQTGTQLGDYFFECNEGPLANKGTARFTPREQIQELLNGYVDFKVEKTTTTLMNEQKVVSEWIVEAIKS